MLAGGAGRVSLTECMRVLWVLVTCSGRACCYQVGPGHPRAVNKKHEGWGGEDAYFTVCTQYALNSRLICLSATGTAAC